MPTEKFLSLLEDVFEAEDAVAPGVDPASIPTSFFSPSNTDASEPILQVQIIHRISKALGKVVRTSKRGRIAMQWESNALATPQQRGAGLASVETPTLSRLLKILERSVRAGEDLDPFNAASRKMERAGSADVSTSPQKAKQNRRSKTPSGPSEDATEHTNNAADVDFAETLSVLELCRNSTLAADCCIHILTCDGLDKQVCSSDMKS